MCVEGPAADCVDTVEPGDAIADCQYDPCYDTPALLPDPLGSDCKQIADDMVACIADPDTPVSSDDPSVSRRSRRTPVLSASRILAVRRRTNSRQDIAAPRSAVERSLR